jgi:hypothetical protein
MKLLTVLALLALPLMSVATSKPTEPVTPATPAVTVAQSSESNSLAAAAARSAARSSATAESASAATGGNATSASGPSTSSAQSGPASAVSGPLSVSSDDDVSVNYPRQVPPVLLPALIQSGCGAGFGAGGASTRSAGSVTALFTSDQCYALQSIGLSIAMGDYAGACYLLHDVNRKAYARRGYTPDCEAFAAKLEAEAKAAAKGAAQPAPPDLSQYATKKELDAAFRASVSK